MKAQVSSPSHFLLVPWQWKEGRTQDGLEAEAEARGGKENKERAGSKGRITVYNHHGRLARRIMGEHREAETPTSNQPPRGAQGRMLMGPAALRTCPFASLLSQARARLGPGGYCRRSGNGGPQTCLPAASGVAQGVAQYGPSPSTQSSRPLRGAKPRGADDARLHRKRPR